MALTILNNIAAIAAENQLNITSNNLTQPSNSCLQDHALIAALTIRQVSPSPMAWKRTSRRLPNPRVTPPTASANCR